MIQDTQGNTYEPVGFVAVLEPVDREEIEILSKALKNRALIPKETTFEEQPWVRVAAAGPGLQYEQGFIPNYVKEGDIIITTKTKRSWAEDFNEPSMCYLIGGKKYCLIDTRDFNCTANIVLIVRRTE